MYRRLSVIALLVAAAACGKSQDQKKAEEAAKQIQAGAEQMAAGAQKAAEAGQAGAATGLQQMAQGFQQMAQGGAKSVDYEKLKPFLPDLGGWEKGKVKGEQVSMGVSISKAETEYTKGDSRIEMEITDSAMSQFVLAPLTMFQAMGYEEKSDEGFKRAAKFGGQPGFEEWNKDSKRGSATAIIGGRFIVTATGHDVDSIDVVRKAVEAVDLAKLAAVK